MEEDEDVLAANSPVLQHLQSVGLAAHEVKFDGVKPVEKSETSERRKKETVDKSILDTITLITSTNLLFEDDRDLIELVFSNFENNKNETLRHMLTGKLSAFVAVFGLFMFLKLGYFAFILVSLFYAYRLTERLWEMHRKQLRFKKFIATLSSNFKLFCNVTKFLRENEALLKVKFGVEPPARVRSCLLNLKDDLLIAQQDVVRLFIDATRGLLDDVPLQQCFDSPEGYVCHEVQNVNDINSISQLHHLFMLLQSQFLTRLTFSIVPMLVKQPERSYKIVNSIMLKIVIQIREISSKLNRKYKFLLRNGVYIQKNLTARPMPCRISRTSNTDHDSLRRNMHDVSNSLQYLLVRARELEASLESDQPQVSGKDLELIQSELASVQQHISDVLIMYLKTDQVSQDEEIDKGDVNVTAAEELPPTDIGFSDLDPRVDDDIFEAVIEDPVGQEVKDNWTEEEIDPLAKKKQRELLGELKTKLKGKAESWAARESIVLARKGMAPIEANTVEPDSVPEEIEINSKKKKLKILNYGDSSDDDEDDSRYRGRFQPMFPQPTISGGMFLSAEMDEFSGSGQNSESEAEELEPENDS